MDVSLTKVGPSFNDDTTAEEMEVRLIEAVNAIKADNPAVWAQKRALLCFIPSMCRYLHAEKTIDTDPQAVAAGIVAAVSNILLNVSAAVIGHECNRCHAVALASIANGVTQAVSSTLNQLEDMAAADKVEHKH